MKPQNDSAKKHSILASGLVALTFLAASMGPAAADTMDIRRADNAVSLEAGASYLDYGETVKGRTFDTETGWLPTVDVGASFLTDESALYPMLRNIYGRLEGRVNVGSTTYDGALQNGTPIVGSTDNRIFSVALQMGRAFSLDQPILLTPFVEIGYRHWNRDLQGIHGYSETYTNWDAMGGLLAQYSPDSRWVLSASGAAGSTFAAGMSTPILLSGQAFGLGSEAIWRTDLKAGYLITDKIELTTRAEYQGFSYGASRTKRVSRFRGAMEPDSSTDQTTLLVGVSYHFF
ncbi:hypothetical protein [Telmatospirillum sp.]|uniref:hypothetical protein n=1 Tax=Telmatospirillum sp. TaxID=2079197 RepID=UPI0028474A88|nr:hypothetical protein [Telmatospirillum sp.]MDR3436374.1 hypothetical protein [Telmatospirillum sp.]